MQASGYCYKNKKEVAKAIHENSSQPESHVVIDADGIIKIVVELPGAKKETIDLRVSEDFVIVSAKNGKNFRGEINLDYAVNPNSAKASYENGVLTIYINKKA